MHCSYVESCSLLEDEVVSTSRHVYELETRLLVEAQSPLKINRRSLYYELKKAEELKRLREMRSIRTKNIKLEKELNNVRQLQTDIDNGQNVQVQQLLATLQHMKQQVEYQLIAPNNTVNNRRSSNEFLRTTELDQELVAMTNKQQVVLRQLVNQINILSRELTSQQEREHDASLTGSSCSDDEPSTTCNAQSTIAFLLIVRGLLNTAPHLIGQVVYGLALSLLVKSFQLSSPTVNIDILAEQID